MRFSIENNFQSLPKRICFSLTVRILYSFLAWRDTFNFHFGHSYRKKVFGFLKANWCSSCSLLTYEIKIAKSRGGESFFEKNLVAEPSWACRRKYPQPRCLSWACRRMQRNGTLGNRIDSTVRCGPFVECDWFLDRSSSVRSGQWRGRS